MADMSTTYGSGGSQTVTTGGGLPGAMRPDMDFFRQLAMRSLAPQPQARAVSPGFSRGSVALPQAPRRASGAELSRQIRNSRAESSDLMRQRHANEFEVNGPRMRNLFGGAQVTGGFIEDRSSIPYSKRGEVSFANTPGDASTDEAKRQNQDAMNFNNFSIGADQRNQKFVDANKAAADAGGGERPDFYGTGNRKAQPDNGAFVPRRGPDTRYR